MQFPIHLDSAARSLIKIRSRYSTSDDMFRNYKVILDCLIKLTDEDKDTCVKALDVAIGLEKTLGA